MAALHLCVRLSFVVDIVHALFVFFLFFFLFLLALHVLLFVPLFPSSASCDRGAILGRGMSS